MLSAGLQPAERLWKRFAGTTLVQCSVLVRLSALQIRGEEPVDTP
jgi:hypothetical protein